MVESHRELLADLVFSIKHGRRDELPHRFVYPDEPEAKWLGKVRAFWGKPIGDSSQLPLVVGSHLACHLLGMGPLQRPTPVAVLDHGTQGDCGAGPGPSGTRREKDRLGGTNFARFNLWQLRKDIYLSISDALQCYHDVRLSYAQGGADRSNNESRSAVALRMQITQAELLLPL